MGDDEILVETAEAFLDDTPAALKNLQDRFANQQWQELYKQAHKIKPGLKYMGIDRAFDLILEIEEEARTENISKELGSKIQAFTSICRKAMEELSDKVERIKSSDN